MKICPSVPCLFLFLGFSLSAQIKTTRIRGTVEDANTRKPIGGATVSASGDTAQQGEITDDNGFFRLVIEGVAPGDLVRIRVVKPGYVVYDRQIVTSEEIPITVDLRRTAPTTPAPAASHKPLVSSDPVTARYIQVMTAETNPLVRINALKVIVKTAAQDPAALAAVVAAINDADYRVRQLAAFDLGKVGKLTPEVITALRIALDDPEPLVHIEAIHALGRFPHNKEAVDILIGVMGTPPHIDADATMTLHNIGVDDPRIQTALIYEATRKNDKNAAAALGQTRQDQNTLDALFAKLGTPPKINIGAMNTLEGMGTDDPRLIAALSYEATVNKDTDSITALGQYPQNKEAVEALLVTLGTPAASNNTALTVLCKMGVDDPRLSEVLIANANTYRAPTVDLLLKKSPLSQDLIARLIQYLASSLDTAQNVRSQIYINVLLQAGGAPGRRALHHLLATSDAQHQALLALAWLEVDHNAKEELLPDLHLPDTQTYLVKLSKTAAEGSVALPEYDSSNNPCNEGPSLRAIMGLSLLDLPPRNSPVKTLIANVTTAHDSCAAYAAAAIGWFGPSILKAASTNLIHDARCKDQLAQIAASDTLALIGDESTIAQLQALNGINNCNDNEYGTGYHNQDALVARIRTRLNAR